MKLARPYSSNSYCWLLVLGLLAATPTGTTAQLARRGYPPFFSAERMYRECSRLIGAIEA